MKNIVTMYEDEGRAGTFLLSEGFKRKHEHVTRLVKKYRKEFEEINTLELQKVKTKGRPVEEYLLTYDQLLFLISLMKNDSSAAGLKLQMIKASSIVKAIELIRRFDFGECSERYIYAAIDEQNRVKIGISNNPQKRIETLNIGNADKLTLVFTKMADKNGYASEIELHEKCEPFLIRSEWFTEDALEVLV